MKAISLPNALALTLAAGLASPALAATDGPTFNIPGFTGNTAGLAADSNAAFGPFTDQHTAANSNLSIAEGETLSQRSRAVAAPLPGPAALGAAGLALVTLRRNRRDH